MKRQWYFDTPDALLFLEKLEQLLEGVNSFENIGYPDRPDKGKVGDSLS